MHSGKLILNVLFPTVVVGDEVIIGYKAQGIKEARGIRTEVDDLFATLKKVNEPKGYYLNGYKEKTFELLRSLLTNKKRYGYMLCPCRLVSGKRDNDRDINLVFTFTQDTFCNYPHLVGIDVQQRPIMRPLN